MNGSVYIYPEQVYHMEIVVYWMNNKWWESPFLAVDSHCAISSEWQLTARQSFGIEISGHTNHPKPTI